MSEKIEDLGNEELVQEYRETVEFRTIESEEGQVSPKEINLRQALEQEILERMETIGSSERTNEVYNYISSNPNCSYSEVLSSVGEAGETIDALTELRNKGEIYEPEKDCLRVTETD